MRAATISPGFYLNFRALLCAVARSACRWCSRGSRLVPIREICEPDRVGRVDPHDLAGIVARKLEILLLPVFLHVFSSVWGGDY